MLKIVAKIGRIEKSYIVYIRHARGSILCALRNGCAILARNRADDTI